MIKGKTENTFQQFQKQIEKKEYDLAIDSLLRLNKIETPILFYFPPSYIPAVFSKLNLKNIFDYVMAFTNVLDHSIEKDFFLDCLEDAEYILSDLAPYVDIFTTTSLNMFPEIYTSNDTEVIAYFHEEIVSFIETNNIFKAIKIFKQLCFYVERIGIKQKNALVDDLLGIKNEKGQFEFLFLFIGQIE
jgi:hypothetical protein